MHGLAPDIFRAKLHQENLRLLESSHITPSQLRILDQVHGKEIIHIANTISQPLPPKADGMITNIPGIALGIHTADCCAIFLVDPSKKAIALLHSGRRGTELEIAQEGVLQLCQHYGSQPKDLIAVLSPCIHGCCYDLDFASQIECQLKNSGVSTIFRHPDCTACHVDHYYSYRKEKGVTGRMLAYLMIR